ncbi:hypothetical protein OC846_006282 [Tilletia horrida]|uniref:Uncharacterized protein n=1 Tax=Tilletia horrida TaxID=155126 RepID=A0AAN6JNS7_9BASI|nr:hypothetical protein OC846_006282 [Tilletia horrida]
MTREEDEYANQYDDEEVQEAAELQDNRSASRSSRRRQASEDEDESKWPCPGTDHVYTKRVLDICGYLQTMQTMQPAEFVSVAGNYDTYVGSQTALESLDKATLDERGRFWIKNDSGGPMLPADERRLGSRTARLGNAFSAQWASEATRPSSITIETTPANASMRRKRAVEGQRVYSCNVCNNAQSAPGWSISCSLPPVHDEAKRLLEQAISAFSTRIKVLKASALAAKWAWVEPKLGGGVMWPRLERSLFVNAGEPADPGRELDVTTDHDLLHLVGEDQGYRYNNVPDVVILDTRAHDQWKIDWRAVHDVTSNACWQVGFFVRVYASTAKKTLGLTLVLDTLVAHGKVPAPSLTSPLPAKRTVDYFSGYDRPEKRNKGPSH